MATSITWPELLIAVVLATLVYLLETMILVRRRLTPDAGSKDEIHELRVELAELRQRIEELEGRENRAEPPEVDAAYSTYDYAVQYARQGMIAPEIAARCGISQDEATLIVALHRESGE